MGAGSCVRQKNSKIKNPIWNTNLQCNQGLTSEIPKFQFFPAVDGGLNEKSRESKACFLSAKSKPLFLQRGGCPLKIYWNFGIFIYIYILYYYYYYYLYGSQGDLPRLKKFQKHFFILEFNWNFLAVLEFFVQPR